MGQVFILTGGCTRPGCSWGGGEEPAQPKPFTALLWPGAAPGSRGAYGESSTWTDGRPDPAAYPLAVGVSKQSTPYPHPRAFTASFYHPALAIWFCTAGVKPKAQTAPSTHPALIRFLPKSCFSCMPDSANAFSSSTGRVGAAA